ncbi:hypothetical protein C9413_06470 [Rhizobium sp. SEMIA 4085]|uniref:Uncharacterized protein n=1 Tax=Rhizobium gallicum bv. gallicum R602sp TaxID=1041138 RepID=A0A0B4XDS6_9HYPH|nr:MULTISPECIES: hypothetical protein [Rhizobium]AJD46139.1 hypothetical protein RGR602_PC02118 [Rhizobium gallicum bv. gallicum R602sp]NNH29161.1 hypothetical protein [Rhizobium sp. SEMIA 4085]
MSDSNSILAAANVQAVIHQIRAIIRTSALDCRCRDVVDDVLEGLERREKAVATEELLKAAVRQRDKIIKLTELLRDFGEVSTGSDGGVIDEAALLFDDLAMQAQVGSQFLHAIAHASDLAVANASVPNDREPCAEENLRWCVSSMRSRTAALLRHGVLPT